MKKAKREIKVVSNRWDSFTEDELSALEDAISVAQWECVSSDEADSLHVEIRAELARRGKNI